MCPSPCHVLMLSVCVEVVVVGYYRCCHMLKFAARPKHSTHTVSLCGALILFLCLLPEPTRTSTDRGDQASDETRRQRHKTRRNAHYTIRGITAVALSYERPWCTKGFARGRAMGDRSHRCCLWAALGLVREVESDASLLVSGSRGAARLWVIVSRVAWVL